jgi:hypothetical protein
MRNVEFYRKKWNEIHLNGAHVVHGELTHENFCRWIRSVPDELPCSKCRRHAQEYIDKHSPENELNSFLWTWEFHNTVNKRKDKPIMDYTSAAILYSV